MKKRIIVNSLSILMVTAALLGLYTISTEDTGEHDMTDTESVVSSDFKSEVEDLGHDLSSLCTDSQTESSKAQNDSESNRDNTDSEKTQNKNKNSDTDLHSEQNTESSKPDTDSQNSDTNTENENIIPYRGIWNEIVVNKYNPIPEGYDFSLTELDNGKMVDSRIVEPLTEMFNAAREIGIYPTVSEAYRTQEDQEEIMQSYIGDYMAAGMSAEQAREEAAKWVAQPGTSEHQLGLALDINGDGENTDNQTVYNWLAENACHYGFVLRYPQGKESITGIDYEPWHYRYVGVAAAEEMYVSGQCLEEYVVGND